MLKLWSWFGCDVVSVAVLAEVGADWDFSIWVSVSCFDLVREAVDGSVGGFLIFESSFLMGFAVGVLGNSVFLGHDWVPCVGQQVAA